MSGNDRGPLPVNARDVEYPGACSFGDDASRRVVPGSQIQLEVGID
jgi:hypothetical protein